MSPMTRPRGPLLAHKLALALLCVSVLVGGLLVLWVGPSTAVSLRARSNDLVDGSATAMRALAAEDMTQQREILTRLIDEVTLARQRTLTDIPLELYGGDVGRIREALRDRDASRGAILSSNVAVLTGEMEARNKERIDAEVGQLVARQSTLAEVIDRDLNRRFLGLTAIVLAVSMGLLGFGLHRLVVGPVRRLGAATRAVAHGDLDVSIRAEHAGDEVSALTVDFARMVDELRASRAEIDRKNAELLLWNERLEQEVARKTAHLEQSMEDLRRAQRRLVHAAKMSSLGTLAGGIAHEFNNLIGGIRGCAREALASESDPERRETLGVIARAAERGAEVTDRLLHFARQRVKPQSEVDLVEVLREARRLMESRARTRQVEIREELPDTLRLHADGSALHQVFLNLMTNAIQAMPHGGTMTIQAERSGDEVVVRVRDTGVGIRKEDQDRVFDPFFSSRENEPDPESRGTGLGLSVSHGLVEAHGGTIDLDSEVGRGTTFTVRLPVARAADSTS